MSETENKFYEQMALVKTNGITPEYLAARDNWLREQSTYYSDRVFNEIVRNYE